MSHQGGCMIAEGSLFDCVACQRCEESNRAVVPSTSQQGTIVNSKWGRCEGCSIQELSGNFLKVQHSCSGTVHQPARQSVRSKQPLAAQLIFLCKLAGGGAHHTAPQRTGSLHSKGIPHLSSVAHALLKVRPPLSLNTLC